MKKKFLFATLASLALSTFPVVAYATTSSNIKFVDVTGYLPGSAYHFPTPDGDHVHLTVVQYAYNGQVADMEYYIVGTYNDSYAQEVYGNYTSTAASVDWWSVTSDWYDLHISSWANYVNTSNYGPYTNGNLYVVY